MSSYPIILYPLPIKSALASRPPEEEFTETPPKKPQPPQRILTDQVVFGLAFFTVLIGVVLTTINFYLSIVFVISTLGLTGFLADREKSKYNYSLKQYRREEEIYRQAYSDYQERKQKHDFNQKKKSNDPKRIAKYRNQFITNELKNTESPEVYESQEQQPQQGTSEKYFHSYLYHYFGNRVKTDLKMRIENFDYPYTPDFVYQEPKKNYI